MRHGLPVLLAQLAAIVAGTPACTVSKSSCDGFVPVQKDIQASAEAACAIARDQTTEVFTNACADVCGDGLSCTVPAEYLSAYLIAASAAAEAGATLDAGDAGDASLVGCPKGADTVQVHCSTVCEGRRTSGIDEPTRGFASLGEYFAACAYLEAASIHAFARLVAELRAHGAPATLVRAARRARRDEVRHAKAVGRLALRFGDKPRWPEPKPFPSRSLADVTLENAVEGCVRETYGAALASVRALRASDPAIREAMRSIALDECRHADLSWRIAAWALPRLTTRERQSIREAMGAAVRSLVEGQDDGLDEASRRVCGMPGRADRRRLAQLLDEHAWASAAVS